MSNAYTLDSYREKLLEKHPYTKIEVIKFLKNRQVLVKDEFGECLCDKSNLLLYGSCTIRAATDKNKYFINQAQKVHGDRFDYTKVVYISSDKRVIIICPIHGEFEQTPSKHLEYKGCSQCSYKAAYIERRSNLESFVLNANKIHNNEYDYSLSVYENAKEKVKILCKKHGEFIQTPNNHLQGQGCAKCGAIRIVYSNRKDLNHFLEKAKIIHKDLYNYDLTEYIHSEKTVKILCSVHGIFYQTPAGHLSGRGCRKCGHERVASLQKNLNNGWNYSIWENKAKQSKNFDSFKVYIIKCWNEEEEFYKIGKSFNKLEKRFSTKASLPYNYSIIKIIESSAEEISKLERHLHKTHKEYTYTPKIYFEGNGECFSKINLELIKNQ